VKGNGTIATLMLPNTLKINLAFHVRLNQMFSQMQHQMEKSVELMASNKSHVL
jgi:chemotaxis protein histidine kinase CheA